MAEEIDLPDATDRLLNDQTEDYNAFKDFVTLDCWIKARSLKKYFIEKIIPLLPPEEKYHLSLQIKDALVSATANIAEGYGRYHFKEAMQFYRMSRGSQFEIKDHLYSCLDFGYIGNKLLEEGIALIENSKRSLNGYIRYTYNKAIAKK